MVNLPSNTRIHVTNTPRAYQVTEYNGPSSEDDGEVLRGLGEQSGNEDAPAAESAGWQEPF